MRVGLCMILNECVYPTYHARQRFTELVRSAASPFQAIPEMWASGEKPTQDDFRVFRVKPKKGYEYRICRYRNSIRVILVVCNGHVVTILDNIRYRST